MSWTLADLTFDLADDETSDQIATIRIGTPLGRVTLMAEVSIDDTTLMLRAAHIQSDAGANALGIGKLNAIAQGFMETFSYDALEIEGAVRTTGARPGHRPRVIRFARRSRDPAS